MRSISVDLGSIRNRFGRDSGWFTGPAPRKDELELALSFLFHYCLAQNAVIYNVLEHRGDNMLYLQCFEAHMCQTAIIYSVLEPSHADLLLFAAFQFVFS